MRKMTGEMVLAAMLTTVALGILLRGLVVLIWSAQQQYPAQALGVPNPSLVLSGGARISMWSRRAGRNDGRRLCGAVRIPALRPLGHAHARGRAEPAARGAARHQSARRLCAGLEPVDAHRRARRHADRARFRPDRRHAGDRAQGVSRGAGRRARQPRGRAGRRADRRRAPRCCSSTTSIRCCPTSCRSWC